MPEQDQAHRHGHPGQAEPRSHGETHHELLRRINLKSASQQERLAGVKLRNLLGWSDQRGTR